jgi:hypothetical protein
VLPPSSKPAQAGAVESGKPQRGWWLGVRATPAWRPFESRPQAARGGLPPMPLAVRREGQVDPVAAACSGLRCARCGALRSLPPPLGRIQHPTRAHRPSVCGPLGWRVHRVARPGAPAGLTGHWTKRRRKGEEERGTWQLTCGPCPAAREARVRLAGGAGGLDWLLGRRVKWIRCRL